MLRVGLTGGIATGKSRVRARLAERGLATLDLDELAHQVLEPGQRAHGEALEAFGASIVSADGRIDRRALGAIVFSDAAARDRLNAIVHPRVFEEEARQIAALSAGSTDVVVTDASLLVESGYHVVFDRLVVTHCDRRQQLGRVMARNGLSAGAAQGRIAAQMPNEEKVRFAHHVIDTGGSLGDTDAAADALAEKLKETAAAWPKAVAVPIARAAASVRQGPRNGPAGLQPGALLRAIAEAGRPPLARLVPKLVPSLAGAWYEGAASRVTRHGAETLMTPVVLWSLAWHGPDVEALLATATSVARLTHWRPAALAGAATYAIALRDVALGGSLDGGLEERVLSHVAAIERRTGAPPPSWILKVIADAIRPAAGPPVSALVTKVRDGDALVGGLRALARSTDPPSPPEIVAALLTLAELPSRR